MNEPNEEPRLPPRWVQAAASIAIGIHLLAIVAKVLAAPSGPWPTPDGGAERVHPPMFAQQINATTLRYLAQLNLTHNYHFSENLPNLATPNVRFEVRLREQAGKEMAVLEFPDPGANALVRHRQLVFARGLDDDQPVRPPEGTLVPAPGQQPPTARIWKRDEDNKTTLTTVELHKLPRTEPAFAPSEWSLILARSLARSLCRTHAAASAEVIRYNAPPFFPGLWAPDANPPPESFFAEQAHSFGVMHGEN